MSKPLVIVESPAKARTISRYLDGEMMVESSVGHIRDLPGNAKEVPAKYKGEPWANLGVNVNDGFTPIYVVNPDKKAQVKALKALLADASELYLATDEDREGEAIAWHLLEILQPKVPVKRMVFHEITKPAIQAAIANPRELDTELVAAQEARRILDRLYGYEVSPVLWKKVATGLSAGRVQSVATRIVVERERERLQFNAMTWFDLDTTLAIPAAEDPVGDGTFEARLTSVDDKRIATGSDFSLTGELQKKDAILLDANAADALAVALKTGDISVESVESKPYSRKPSAPFITSTLQQEAGHKLRFSANRTMSTAQRLYENGFITYMRTDSVTLSKEAVDAARAQISERYGADYLPAQPRAYKSKSKNAQEAHEAIRPAGSTFRTPEDVKGDLTGDQLALYELIWTRTVASQMEDAKGETVQAKLKAIAGNRTADFSASGRTITFPGFLRAYVEGSDDPEQDLGDKDKYLPPLSTDSTVSIASMEPAPHETKPPARFTEASLVKKLEELGVGRPSTYASIISTIQNRGYVWKRASALIPSFTAFAVTGLLEDHFPELVDYAFTARMESDLDTIANGEMEHVPWLAKFYFGEGEEGLKDKVINRLSEIDARAVNSIPLGVTADGQAVTARVGRYGPYIERGEDRASIPDDIAPDELTLEVAMEYLDRPSDDRELGVDKESGKSVWVRNGRFGPYVQFGHPDDGKPEKTGSLFKTMNVDDITFDEAMKLLSLPRILGEREGEPIEVMNGRYGPYIKNGKDTRSLESEDEIFTISLEDAEKKLAEPKRRGRGAAKPPLKELGEDPNSGSPMIVKDGRFGEYVTDGEVNASLRRGDTVENLTAERAAELLAERRLKIEAQGGPKKKAKKKKATKKKAKKKAAKKKKATKKTAKKSTAKKTAKKKATKKTAKKTDG